MWSTIIGMILMAVGLYIVVKWWLSRPEKTRAGRFFGGLFEMLFDAIFDGYNWVLAGLILLVVGIGLILLGP